MKKIDRLILKKQVENERRPLTGPVLCELCGQARAAHLHEIVNGVVPRRYPAQLFVPPLLSLLCPACNMVRADTGWAREILLARNIARYGRAAVQDALDALEAAMNMRTGITVPLEENDEQQIVARSDPGPGADRPLQVGEKRVRPLH